jgi:SAM-dependent methyltransferase
VVVGQQREPLAEPEFAAPGASPEVVWHDLECGSYRADLALWRELAAQNPGPVLDIGAGTGRVALALARWGHAVTALEREPTLLATLRARATGASVRTLCADARSFALPAPAFALCIVPMQTVQLLGGAAGRAAFLKRARAHLRGGGLLACALLAGVNPFDCTAGEDGPAPERTVIAGLRYTSWPTRVSVGPRRVVIERERQIEAAGGTDVAAARWGARTDAIGRERNVVELDRLSAARLRREARALGFAAPPARHIPATEEHAGSTVVMLRA